ncbi:MAG: hypothetical protein KQH83_02675 [Actinobacteria bacterium]|nr:hypothetical protein [Actinomycetota bacterium]
MDAAPVPGAEETIPRVTALPRPWIRPRLLHTGRAGHAPDDPAVRRFWVALVGPGAVADLLRLTAAARTGRQIRRPVHLAVLLREGLAEREGDDILVHPRVPTLLPCHLRRLRPSLRAEYLALQA